MPFIEVNDCKFYYQQKGKGQDVVLIHAFTSNTAIWLFTNTLSLLAKQYRVTAYDLRGHGSTQVTPTGYKADEMARDSLALQQALDVGSAVIIGHSYGGVIGMYSALLDPEQVKGVIFSDTYFPGLNHLEPDMGQSEPWADLRAQMQKVDIEIGETVDFQGLFKAVKSMGLKKKAILAKNMGAVSASWISTLGSLAETTAGSDAFDVAGLTADKIADVNCPVVALYDEFSPFHKTREFLEDNLPRIESTIVPGAKHLAPLQSTDDFQRLVGEGIESILELT